MLPDYRKLIDQGLSRFRSKSKDKVLLEKEHDILMKKINAYKKIQSIFKEASVLTQSFTGTYIQDVVTDSIRIVFPDRNIKFTIKFVTTRDTQCIIGMEENGKPLSLFDSEGYGILDIISISLRAAYIILDNSEKVLILDEPFRNLSLDRHELAARMLSGLSHKLELQIIINTHLTHIEQYADSIISVKQNQKTKVSTITVDGVKHETGLEKRKRIKNVLQKRNARKILVQQKRYLRRA